MNAVAEMQGQRLRASPVARRLAMSRGIALDRIRGSGPRGRIVRLDVERTGAPAPEPRPGATLLHGVDIPVEALLELHAALGAARTEPISLDALLLKAIDQAFASDGLSVGEIDLRSSGVAAIARGLLAGPRRLTGGGTALWVTHVAEGSGDAVPAAPVAGAAQLVFAAPAERVLPRDGVPAVVVAMRCSLLAGDAMPDGAAFLARLRRLIEQPLGIVA